MARTVGIGHRDFEKMRRIDWVKSFCYALSVGYMKYLGECGL